MLDTIETITTFATFFYYYQGEKGIGMEEGSHGERGIITEGGSTRPYDARYNCRDYFQSANGERWYQPAPASQQQDECICCKRDNGSNHYSGRYPYYNQESDGDYHCDLGKGKRTNSPHDYTFNDVGTACDVPPKQKSDDVFWR